MNRLSIEKRIQIVNLLVKGMSMRSISRVADVSINTVTKMLEEVGTACCDFQDKAICDLPLTNGSTATVATSPCAGSAARTTAG